MASRLRDSALYMVAAFPKVDCGCGPRAWLPYAGRGPEPWCEPALGLSWPRPSPSLGRGGGGGEQSGGGAPPTLPGPGRGRGRFPGLGRAAPLVRRLCLLSPRLCL